MACRRRACSSLNAVAGIRGSALHGARFRPGAGIRHHGVQILASAGDARADRADRAAADRRGLGVGAAEQLGQHERRPSVRSQRGQQLVDRGLGAWLGWRLAQRPGRGAAARRAASRRSRVRAPISAAQARRAMASSQVRTWRVARGTCAARGWLAGRCPGRDHRRQPDRPGGRTAATRLPESRRRAWPARRDHRARRRRAREVSSSTGRRLRQPVGEFPGGRELSARHPRTSGHGMRQDPRGHLGPDRRRRPRRAGRRARGAPGGVRRLPRLAAAGARGDAAGAARRHASSTTTSPPGVLAAIPPAGAATGRDGGAGRMARRAGLAAVALAQLAITVPLLILGHDHDAGDARRARAGLVRPGAGHRVRRRRVRPALSAGLAWPCAHRGGRPGRQPPIVDLISGQTFGADEAQHLVAAGRRRAARAGRPGPPHRDRGAGHRAGHARPDARQAARPAPATCSGRRFAGAPRRPRRPAALPGRERPGHRRTAAGPTAGSMRTRRDVGVTSRAPGRRSRDGDAEPAAARRAPTGHGGGKPAASEARDRWAV